MSLKAALGPRMVAGPQDPCLVQPASCGGKRMKSDPALSHGGRLGPDLLVGPHQCWADGLGAGPAIASTRGLWQSPPPGVLGAQAYQPWTCWLRDPHLDWVAFTFEYHSFSYLVIRLSPNLFLPVFLRHVNQIVQG